MKTKEIGRYVLREKLGRGATATVYRAYDPSFERDVAIKLQPLQFRYDSGARERFRREAKIIASLEHPAIVPVYDLGVVNEQSYIVMRLMDGGTLRDKLKQGGLPLAEMAALLSWIAPALDEAHQAGVIHRDLKPGNILFDQQQRAYIADFGIAKLIEGNVRHTLSGGGIIGTPAYMSPEQARGEADLDGRSDLYAVGVMLFEMLTGQLPFQAETPLAMVLRHLNEPVPMLEDVRAGLSSDYQVIIERSLAKNKEERYPTVQALSEVFQNVVQHSSNTLLLSLPAKPASIGSFVETSSHTIEAPPSPERSQQIGSFQISPRDGMKMMFVPAGEFIMHKETPLYLDGFWIDISPITNAMFARFVAETGYNAGEKWRTPLGVTVNADDAQAASLPAGTPRKGQDLLAELSEHPVVYISWHDACAYSEWAGRRLPTQAEWEKAARGVHGFPYPWGMAAPDRKKLNFNFHNRGTSPVHQYPAGASPYGALDMLGNVWEWVADASNKNMRILRGGCWNSTPRQLHVTMRKQFAPMVRLYHVGFRCVKSL